MLDEMLLDIFWACFSLSLSWLGLRLTLRIIYGAGWRREFDFFLYRTSTGAKLGMIACLFSLAVLVSFGCHYVSDYGIRGGIVRIMRTIPSLNEPLDPPLEIETCPGEWYPGCSYD